MYNLRPANNFQGVDLVLSECELDALIYQFDSMISKIENEKELEELRDKLISLKRVFLEFAYFDEEEREVHCRLGYYELQLMIESIIIALPKSDNNAFNNALDNPDTKRWTYRARENDSENKI